MVQQQILQSLDGFLDSLEVGAQPATSPYLPPTAVRLASALLEPAKSKYAPSGLDLACLLAQVLRQRDLLSKGSRVLRLPLPGPWPKAQVWESAGVEAVVQDGRLRLRATPWQPEWLGGVEVAADAIMETPRNPQHTQAIDPFVESLTGYSSYTSSAQKQSLRSLWVAPKGSTLLSIMPTGSGKSLLLQILALQAALRSGCVVVVVPTVSLALDQERAIKELAARQGVPLPSRLAYYSDQNPGERLALQEGLANGRQPVIFTSPDSLMGTLKPSLIQAAEGGHLVALVIDEAHYVAQWGSEFRPDFQSMAGIRRHLLRLCPEDRRFVTLLLTATLTPEGLETLRVLFGQPGPFQMVSSVSLRPEMSYFVVDCGLPEEPPSEPATRAQRWAMNQPIDTPEAKHRMKYLLEAVVHLPRPMIVYTTRPVDAEAISKDLHKLGLKRVGVVTGRSSGSKREQALRAWRADQLDVMVATSAFGVGVDQAHVRTVIHACVPENLDRFYQEVGRSGRDGAASVSLWLHIPEDWDIARSQSQQAMVTLDVGMKRWNAMFNTASDVGFARKQVSLNARPPRVDFAGSTNRLWNQRTLNLMARAQLIELDADSPPPQEGFSTFAEYEQALQRHTESVVVEIMDLEHSTWETWNARIEPVRARQASADLKGLQALRVLARAHEPFEQVFANTYVLGSNDIQVWPALACGGCPACRASSCPPYAASAQPVKLAEYLELPAVQRYSPLNCVGYAHEDGYLGPPTGVLKQLIEDGYRLIVASESFWPPGSRLRFQRDLRSDFFFCEDGEKLHLQEVGGFPMVVLLGPSEPWPEWLDLNDITAPTVVVCALGRKDPRREDLTLMQVLGGLTVEQFIRGRKRGSR